MKTLREREDVVAVLIWRRTDFAVFAAPPAIVLVPAIVVIWLIVALRASAVRGECCKRCAANDCACDQTGAS